MYVSEYIGTEYRHWNKRDIILITAPTGSGKSHFALYTLLMWAIENKEKVLYLVNRKILKRQIEEELKEEVTVELYKYFGDGLREISQYISVDTYQSIERKIERGYQISEWLGSFKYVIYDECHYFYADSTFNTMTQVSYDCLRVNCHNSVQIFMSATMRHMREIVTQTLPNHPFIGQGRVNLSIAKKMDGELKKRIYEYPVPTNYDSVNLNQFLDDDHLVKIIKKNTEELNEKWLIFTDSIERGKNIQKALMNADMSNEKNSGNTQALHKEDIVFIDADYETDTDAEISVRKITEEKLTNKKVVIATAVMDNGISIYNQELRNVVIMADTEEEFIQMLGRKRRNPHEMLNLYIHKRNVAHFEKRLRTVREILRFYEDYGKQIEKMYIISMPANGENVQVEPLFFPNYVGGTGIGFLVPQQKVLSAFLHSESLFHNARRIIYSLYGQLAINTFALNRCRELKMFYLEMIQLLEKDEDAFLKRQMQWLGFDKQKVDEVLQVINQSEEEKRRERVKEAIAGVVGDELSKEKNLKLRKKIREDLIYFFEKSQEYKEMTEEERKKMKTSITRTDVGIAVNTFNSCMRWVGLPYVMENIDGISRITENACD